MTITDSKIVEPAQKWNPDYLAKHSKKTWVNSKDRGVVKGVDLPISLAAYFSKSLEFMYVRPGTKKTANSVSSIPQIYTI